MIREKEGIMEEPMGQIIPLEAVDHGKMGEGIME
jgi:hypothetical protein